MSLYETELGDRLVNPDNFPQEINAFLQLQNSWLAEELRGRQRLIEIGSMDGLSMDFVSQRPDLRYLGIEPIDRYVHAALHRMRKYPEDVQRRLEMKQGSAAHLSQILDCTHGESSLGDLIFFPFNSFGNVTNVELTVQALAATGRAFCVATYPVTDHATNVRRAYYEACNYEELQMENFDSGIVFRSKNGFCSWAYRPEYLALLFRQFGLELTFEVKEGILLLAHSLVHRT